MIVKDIEFGFDFITLYFKTQKDLKKYSETLYGWFNNIANFPYKDLQRRNFRHLPGDVPHFHPNGDPLELGLENRFHFHILYPKKPTDVDWKFLSVWGNRLDLEIDQKLINIAKEVK